jgi:hypothetical protein
MMKNKYIQYYTYIGWNFCILVEKIVSKFNAYFELQLFSYTCLQFTISIKRDKVVDISFLFMLYSHLSYNTKSH